MWLVLWWSLVLVFQHHLIWKPLYYQSLQNCAFFLQANYKLLFGELLIKNPKSCKLHSIVQYVLQIIFGFTFNAKLSIFKVKTRRLVVLLPNKAKQAFFVHSKSSSIEFKISRIHTSYGLNTDEVDKSTHVLIHHKESTGAHKKGLVMELLVDWQQMPEVFYFEFTRNHQATWFDWVHKESSSHMVR